MTTRSSYQHLSIVGLTGLLVASACPRDAGAESSTPDPAAATAHAKRARVAYDVQDWATAINEYQAAYKAEQRPDFLWALAQARRLGGDCATAISTYKAYRRSDVSASQASAAEVQISKCEAELTKRSPADSTRKPETGLPAAPSASLAAALSREHVVASAADPAPRSPTSPFYKDALGDALLLSGVVAGGVGTYFLFKGNSDMRDAGSASVYGDYSSTSDRASKEQLTGVISLGAGTALIAGALFRFWTRSSAPSSERAVVVLGPDGIAVLGRF